MKTFFLIAGLLTLLSCKTQSQEVVEVPFTLISDTASQTKQLSDFITASELEETVYFLASDDLKGRATGSLGIQKAADYIESKLKSYEILPYFDSYRDDYTVNELKATNIVGVIEGNDPMLKNEFIIISAHYDHIGIIESVAGDSIANGANDDASGVAAVLALARYFSTVKNNKRSILFTLYSGEEIGLKGSNHLAERLKRNNVNLYTMINFEMIGVPMVDKPYDAYFTGFDLSNMASKMNDYASKELLGELPEAKEFQLFYRSDNYSFYNIFNKPSHVISTYDFTNFDHYHKVGDEPELLNYNFMAKLVNQLIPAFETMSNTTTQEIKMYE